MTTQTPEPFIYNPHIRGLKQVKSCLKLSQRTKQLYSSIFPKPVETLESEFPPYKPRGRLQGFQPAELFLKPSKLKHSLSSNQKTSSSGAKDPKVFKKQELSISEEAKVEEMIKLKLKSKHLQIKNSICKKIQKNSETCVFPQDFLNTRVESLAAVEVRK
jgi:hypothetical protein